MITDDRKAPLQAIHNGAVTKAENSLECNAVLDNLPLPINNTEKDHTRKDHSTLAQHWGLLGSHKSRIKKYVSLNIYVACGKAQHDAKHLFVFPAHPTTLTPADVWSRPTDYILELRFLKATDPNWNKHGLKDEQQQQF